MIVIKKLGTRYSLVMITRKVFLYGTLTLIPFMFFMPSHDLSLQQVLHVEVVLHLLFLAIVASFLCFIGWNYAATKIDAMKLSNLIYIVPIVSIVASVLFLDERITPLAILGLFMVITGLYLNTRKR